MKKHTFLLLLSLLVWTLNSCGIEVMEVELTNGSPNLVIEGTISNKPGPHFVKISWSTPFNSKEPVYEENALVILSNTEGKREYLLHNGHGQYLSTMEGKAGVGYQLQVFVNGAEYEAFSTMPEPAQLDSISVRYFDETQIWDEGYYVFAHNLDPNEKEGYYRWLVWVNDTLKTATDGGPGYFASIDKSIDDSPLSLQYPEPFKKGDKVLFQTIKMDKKVYSYYQGILELMINDGGLLGPVPVNPPSNLSGNALGVFQAVSIKETLLDIQ